MKKENGITLVALIITIILLLIIASISVNSSIDSIEKTKLKGFYTQLEIIQKRVDDIAATNESYLVSEGNIVYLKETGHDLTDEQKASLQSILEQESINVTVNNFRYYTVEDLENDLELIEINFNVFIDFENRIIVAENGVTVNDITYHVLKTSTNFVKVNSTDKNIGQIDELNFHITSYGDKYKVVVTTNNTIGDLDGNGYVEYKTTTSKYWKTSDNNEMILVKDIEYNIVYKDKNNNSKSEIIKIELDDNLQPQITII